MSFLRNIWYVAAWARELEAGVLLRRRLLGEFYVLFRDADGTARALVDRCPHRFAPLSMGRLVGDGSVIQCPYHGLCFDSRGQCVTNPHGDNRIPRRAVVATLPLVEKFSAIWAWMGDPDQADAALIPELSFMDPETHAVACDMINIDAHYELCTDNILDLSHIEYVHPLFSSPAVSQGKYECVLEDDAVWSKRYIASDDLPPFLLDAFGLAEGQKADRWMDARWSAPAVMALWTGAVESGKPPEDGREVVGAHIFTPESENRTHYFFATSFPRALGPQAEEMARESLSAATGPEGVFTSEDKPIIEGQAHNMHNEEFWSWKPIVLSIDAAAVHARRILAKKIAGEASASALRKQAQSQ